MASITKCDNEECKLKETCYRYTAKPHKYTQSYIMDAKIICEDRGYDHYWDNKD